MILYLQCDRFIIPIIQSICYLFSANINANIFQFIINIMDFLQTFGTFASGILTIGGSLLGLGNTSQFQKQAQNATTWLGASQYDQQSTNRTLAQTATNVTAVTGASAILGRDAKQSFLAASAAQMYGKSAGFKNKNVDLLTAYAATQSQRSVKKSSQMFGLLSLFLGPSVAAYAGMFYLIPAPVRNKILQLGSNLVMHKLPLVFSAGKIALKNVFNSVKNSNMIRQITTAKNDGVWVGKIKSGSSISQQTLKLSYSQFFMAVMCQGAVYVLRYDKIDTKDPQSLKKVFIQLSTQDDIDAKFNWQWTGILKNDPQQFIDYFKTHQQLIVTMQNIHLLMRQFAYYVTDRQTLVDSLYPFYTGQIKIKMKRQKILKKFQEKKKQKQEVLAFRDQQSLKSFQQNIYKRLDQKIDEKQQELQEMRQQIYEADDD